MNKRNLTEKDKEELIEKGVKVVGKVVIKVINYWLEHKREKERQKMEELHRKKTRFIWSLPITLSIAFIFSSFTTFVFLFILQKFHIPLLFYQPSQAINYTDLLISSSLLGGISTFIGFFFIY